MATSLGIRATAVGQFGKFLIFSKCHCVHALEGLTDDMSVQQCLCAHALKGSKEFKDTVSDRFWRSPLRAALAVWTEKASAKAKFAPTVHHPLKHTHAPHTGQLLSNHTRRLAVLAAAVGSEAESPQEAAGESCFLAGHESPTPRGLPSPCAPLFQERLVMRLEEEWALVVLRGLKDKSAKMHGACAVLFSRNRNGSRP